MRRSIIVLRVALAFLTRIPGAHPDGATQRDFSRAFALFPIVGLAIGAALGMVLVVLERLGCNALTAAALTTCVGALLTGSLHEDGLADTADGFGGGRDRQAKLDIMRDSRIGSYGTVALVTVSLVKVSTLAALRIEAVIPTLAFVHAGSRSAASMMCAIIPPARKDGLAAEGADPSRLTLIVSVLVSIAAGLVLLPPRALAAACVVAASVLTMLAIISRRQIGGFTGDVLGATQQLAEVGMLVALAPWVPI